MSGPSSPASPLLDAWMPEYDVAARYSIRIPASPAHVYPTLMASDLSRPWVVRALMGLRILPSLFRTPGATWRRWRRPSPRPRSSLGDLGHSDFILLEEAPPHEIVLGISGRFWTLAAQIVPIPAARFREPLPAGLAQAAWNFAVFESPGGATLTTETRIRCADLPTRRSFQRYWRLVGPGSGLIRHAILRQVREESVAIGNDPG